MTICPDARETILTSDSETETNGAGLSVTYQDVVKLVLSEKYCHAGGLLPYWPAAYFCPNYYQGPPSPSLSAGLLEFPFLAVTLKVSNHG